MEHLTKKEMELVAIGAALASNCVPCIVYHIKEAKKNGMPEPLIVEAIQVADKVRQVPADKVRRTALAQLEIQVEEEPEPAACC
ncbi:carboxymuconolactone decarboxylase family protein [Oligoflexia bacterium]|nr:carboxymuconolactone decarboxylase family protein [Oligoflexia bacterium]